jgi:2-polyprenyl-3-methyl-5-hydroxy-6-metoxy-1,4-benzoquinol methylase
VVGLSIGTDTIASDAVPNCYLCGLKGASLYEGLSDRWFGAPGAWNLTRCPDPGCGLVWMDPMPSRSEVWKAYRTYFTHRDYSPEERHRIGMLDYLLLKILKPFYKAFWYATGFRSIEKRWRKRRDEMFLGEAIPGGRLLDVGCGHGEYLARMRRQGWVVEGSEVDSSAVDWARESHGLTVHLGTLESLRLPGDSYSAVTMSHVIEHVHDPIALLGECFRILLPGGKLVVATPNIESFGHRWFGRNWSNLDPPRHLHLFSRRTLKECATRAGFRSIEVWCAPGYAEGALLASVDCAEEKVGEKSRSVFQWLKASLLKVGAYFLFFVRRDESVGEEVILVATKEGDDPSRDRRNA